MEFIESSLSDLHEILCVLIFVIGLILHQQVLPTDLRNIQN